MKVRFVAIAATLTIVVLGIACSTERESPPQDAEQNPTRAPVNTATQRQASLPATFSVTRMNWVEAENALGYPIVKSERYPLTWPYLFVQPSVEAGAVPRKAVGLYTINGSGVRVVVAPEITWNDGTLRRGTSLILNGYEGGLQTDDEFLSYAFPCGKSPEYGDVWCQVGINSSSTELLAKFVDDLRVR